MRLDDPKRLARIQAGLESHLYHIEALARKGMRKARPIPIDPFEAARKQAEAEREDQSGEAHETERRNFADRRRLAMRHADLRDGYAVRGQTRNQIEGEGPVHSKRQPRYDDDAEKVETK